MIWLRYLKYVYFSATVFGRVAFAALNDAGVTEDGRYMMV